jgi:AraC-like DNA-binding protein
MPEQRVDPPRGLLNLDLADGRVQLARYVAADPAIGFFIEHYWIVRWHLAGQPPFTSETLPYPSVHVVLEQHDSRVVGVPRGKFTRKLRGDGFVFGIKFKPGGFRPFVAGPVSQFANRSVVLASVLDYGPELADAVLGAGSDAAMIGRAEAVLLRHLPEQEPHVPELTAIVDGIAADRSIVRVEQLIGRYGLGVRALQRLFREYVGVTPKWVIQRYRLFEAAERLSAGDADGAVLAHALGYFDQAHFIRDFKAMVGKPPLAFARTLVASATSR